MPTLLTFGDSNTHGTPPMPAVGADVPRISERWPVVAARLLGWDLVEEGLPGRTTCRPDPVMGTEMDGTLGLKIALRSHGPVDWLTIMLGTNDLKARFAPSVEGIVAGLAGLVDVALSPEMQQRHGGFRILLIAPPPVIDTGPFAGEFLGAEAISKGLAPAVKRLAVGRGLAFLDAGAIIEVSATDGIHFDVKAHERLGQAVARSLH